MTTPLFVSSSTTGSGKTAVAIALGQLAQKRGYSVGYMKPKGTRLRSYDGNVQDEDAKVATELLSLEDTIDDITPLIYSSAFQTEVLRGRIDQTEYRERIRESFSTVSTGKDGVIIEGSTRLEAGGMVSLADPACAALLNARVVLVSEYHGPNDLDIVLSRLSQFTDSSCSVLFNDISEDVWDQLEVDVLPFLAERGISVLGMLPHRSELASISIQELADSIGATVLTSCPTDRRIERFTVGAMSGDAAYHQFRRVNDSMVVTGGDRPVVQTAAIEAPGVSAVLVTSGERPSDAIVRSANTHSVPILLSPVDSVSTIERVEQIIREGRARDSETIGVMCDLLKAHIDLDAFFADYF